MNHLKDVSDVFPRSHFWAAGIVSAVLVVTLGVYQLFDNTSSEVDDSANHLVLETKNESGDDIQIDALVSKPFNKDVIRTRAQNTTSTKQVTSLKPIASQVDDPSLLARPLDITVKVNRNQKFPNLLSQAGVDKELIKKILLDKNASRFNKLKADQEVQFKFASGGKLELISAQLSQLESISLAHKDGQLVFDHVINTPQNHTRYVDGFVKGSLFSSTDRAGLSKRMARDLSGIFGYDIDFAKDLHHGDQFEVLFEEKVANDKRVGEGVILAARFMNRGKVHTAVRYTDSSGQTSYYTPDGNNLKKAFIRTPVDFARISSKFDLRRSHPILNTIRAHKGVDYAAPTGTPIKASGDGVIELAGRKGGYGNTIVLKHGQRYTTVYGHMSRFAKGIKVGKRVRQGQVIGYVGTTGLSTGPHLHYEFQINGVHVDPLKQKQLMAEPVSRSDVSKFRELSRPLLAKMDNEKSNLVVMNKRK